MNILVISIKSSEMELTVVTYYAFILLDWRKGLLTLIQLMSIGNDDFALRRVRIFSFPRLSSFETSVR